ncbi:MAG: cysteine hydrolase family protein [Deltaproteobacteria bacterium]|nr:cysteine hydrolase family protein [Nannocystaceae bacterium]
MRTIIVDVDTQRDFMLEEGALFVDADAAVRLAIARVLQHAQREGTPIIGSVDSHAYDAWEFRDNGGPFARHCVKGTPGWLRVFHDVPRKTRFVAMQPVDAAVHNLVGEAHQGEGVRTQGATELAAEAVAGVGVYFEKEVYSLFSNPAAAPVVAALVEALGGVAQVRFDVLGYCTGGYCVDAAAHGLRERGYEVRVLGFATAAIGGSAGQERSSRELTHAGIEWVSRP